MSDYDKKYKNTIPYPSKDDYTTIFIYKAGRVIVEEKLSTYKLNGKVDGVEEKVVDKEGYDAAMKVYRAEDNRLFNQFKEDVLEENGLTNHPKAMKVFALAWEEGHSSGYENVAYYVDKYADLVRD